MHEFLRMQNARWGFEAMAFRLKGLLVGAAAVVWAAGSVSPAAAATALSGSLNVTATTILSPNSPYDTSVAVVDNLNPTATPTTLNASVSSTSASAGDTVSASGTASATWASANAGSVTLSNFGWQFNTATNYSSAYFGQPDPSPNGIGPLNDWNYTFTATGDGEFLMTYNVTGSGPDLFGLAGWGIGSDCVGCVSSGGPTYDPFNPTANGTFVAQISAGQTYTFGLINQANLYVGTPGIAPSTLLPAAFNGSMSGQFDWSIVEDAVPEPASWSMLLLGLGAMGAVLRRRRSGGPVAA